LLEAGRGVMSDSAGRNGLLLDVRDLRKYFPVRRGVLSRTVGYVKAVDGVSFGIREGETLGLVGESGCGKTTVGRTILRLLEPTGGEVYFEGRNVFELEKSDMRALRRKMQIIFQDPYSSLNPRMTVGAMLEEALKIHRLASGEAAKRRVAELLENTRVATRTSSAEDRGSGSASRAPSRSHPAS